MNYETCLLIVCRTLSPFVSFDLLVDDQTPTADADKIMIRDLFFNLNEQDKKFGLHVVNEILERLVKACFDEGFALVLGKGQLVKGQYPTVKAMAMALKTRTEAIET